MKNSLAVVVGRFQSDYLHKGYLALFNHILDKHEDVLLVVGTTPALGTRRDPLDFVSRAAMLEEWFDNETLVGQYRISIHPLSDRETDEIWSKSLDELITKTMKEHKVSKATLYGGRDNFFPHYKGKFPTKTVSLTVDANSTSIREEIGKGMRNSPDFRAGVIYASQKQYPRTFPTVDIAITKAHPTKLNTTMLLLGCKPGNDALRFPGGFVDPTDESLAFAAARELSEEVPDLEVGGAAGLTFVTSRLVKDWRYAKGQDRIMTSLFHGTYVFGPTRPGDDLAKVGWYPIGKATRDKVWPSHQHLYDALITYLRTKENQLCTTRP